jgi:hypothetical protein
MTIESIKTFYTLYEKHLKSPTIATNGVLMSPNKPFDVQVEDVIDVDISAWQEERYPIGTSMESDPLDFDKVPSELDKS